MDILLIDENDNTTHCLGQRIKSWGHHVDVCTSGNDSLELVRKRKFDLVILNAVLQDMKGYDLIPKIKNLWPNIGIVFMCENNSREIELNARTQGIFYYLLKPHEIKNLEDVVVQAQKKLNAEPEYRQAVPT